MGFFGSQEINKRDVVLEIAIVVGLILLIVLILKGVEKLIVKFIEANTRRHIEVIAKSRNNLTSV